MINDNGFGNKEEDLDFIEVERGKRPQGKCIIESVSGNKWLDLESYSHLEDPYVMAVRIPMDMKTYKIIER